MVCGQAGGITRCAGRPYDKPPTYEELYKILLSSRERSELALTLFHFKLKRYVVALAVRSMAAVWNLKCYCTRSERIVRTAVHRSGGPISIF
jgi:hypothetical protein